MPLPGLSEAKFSDDDKKIKVDVTLVTVPTMVIGSNGGYVRDLKAPDFRLFENGVQQKIDRIFPAAEPVNMVLVLGYMPVNVLLNSEFSFKDVQRSAIEFVDAMRAEDRIMVVSFDDKIHIESEFTNDRERLRQAILQMNFGCGSRLYDAVDLVMTERLSRISGRKVMVLFTDGRDWGSRLVNAGKTLARTEEPGVPVYAVQYPIALPNNRAEYWPSEYLLNLSSGSGGRHSLAKNIQDLARSFAQIADELHNQYTLCYYPSDKPRNGDYRRVSVVVDRPGVKVRAPTGYRAKF
jgi:VWFA-related protein